MWKEHLLPPWELLESLPLFLNILVVYPECANQYDNLVFNISKHKVWSSSNVKCMSADSLTLGEKIAHSQPPF